MMLVFLVHRPQFELQISKGPRKGQETEGREYDLDVQVLSTSETGDSVLEAL